MPRDTFVCALQDYGLTLTRLISESALDPHLYFEQKLAGKFRAASAEQDLIDMLSELAQWVQDAGFDSSQTRRWDAELASHSFPSLALWRDKEQHVLARTLMSGEQQNSAAEALVRAGLSDATLSESDLELCKTWLSS